MTEPVHDRRDADKVSMRDYVDTLFGEKDKRDVAAMEAWRSAYSRDERDMERRLDSMNEFRQQLTDQAATFMTRLEFDNRHADLANQMVASFDERDKRTSLALTVTSDALIKADIASDKRFERIGDVAAALAGVDARIHVLEQQQAASSGRSGGLNAGWGYLVGTLGFIIATGALLFDVFAHN